MAESDPASDALCDVVYGLAVVGTVSADGEPNGMTANWMSQVSFDPRDLRGGDPGHGAHAQKH